MLSLQLRFDAAHFHATPWQSQVNEGAVEWPPSPFRLLRTLVAVGHTRTNLGTAQLIELFEALASAPPEIESVPITQAQARHYMPQYADGATTKVLDTSAVVERLSAEDCPWHVRYSWPQLALSAELADVLSGICSQVTYFGRAESWATFEVVNGGSARDSGRSGPKHRAVATMLPLLPNDTVPATQFPSEIQAYPYPLPQPVLEMWGKEWLSGAVARELAIAADKAAGKGKDFDETKQRKKIEAKCLEKLPAHVLAVLSADTNELQKEGWSHPPGTFDVRYVRPATQLVEPRASAPPVSSAETPTVARFLVTSRVKPQARFALYFAETVRASVLSWVGRLNDGHVDEALVGRKDGEVAKENHKHLHIFCETSDTGQHIVSVVVYAPEGLSPEVQLALRQPGRMIHGRGAQSVSLALITMSTTALVAGFDSTLARSSLFATSRRWTSTTPFVSTRFTKKGKLHTMPDGVEAFDGSSATGELVSIFGAGQIVDGGTPAIVGDAVSDLLRLLDENHPGAKLVRLIKRRVVEPHDGTSARATACGEFRTSRRDGKGARGAAYPAAFELTFAEPFTGPLALGYGAHFSLGLFRALPE
jgi:CRISPR-associated protein Csb2